MFNLWVSRLTTVNQRLGIHGVCHSDNEFMGSCLQGRSFHDELNRTFFMRVLGLVQWFLWFRLYPAQTGGGYCTQNSDWGFNGVVLSGYCENQQCVCYPGFTCEHCGADARGHGHVLACLHSLSQVKVTIATIVNVAISFGLKLRNSFVLVCECDASQPLC